MGVKVILVLVSAVLAIATAYPFDRLPLDGSEHPARISQQRCSTAREFIIRLGSGTQYRLQSCIRMGQRCVNGLPENRCEWGSDGCYYYKWYVGSAEWNAEICQGPFGGHCHGTSSMLRCKDIDLAQISAEAESFEGVQICETDDNGIEHCRSLSEGINAEVMAEPDCVCVGDRKGHSVCMPDNCDANRPTRRRG